MSFEEKKQAALAELENSKTWCSNYEPPHYNSFMRNALFRLFFWPILGCNYVTIHLELDRASFTSSLLLLSYSPAR